MEVSVVTSGIMREGIQRDQLMCSISDFIFVLLCSHRGILLLGFVHAIYYFLFVYSLFSSFILDHFYQNILFFQVHLKFISLLIAILIFLSIYNSCKAESSPENHSYDTTSLLRRYSCNAESSLNAMPVLLSL